MVTTEIPAHRRKSLPPRKKAPLCGLLVGLRLLLVLLLWVSMSVASCVRVTNSITARSTIFSRMPEIVSAQQITAPEFNLSPRIFVIAAKAMPLSRFPTGVPRLLWDALAKPRRFSWFSAQENYSSRPFCETTVVAKPLQRGPTRMKRAPKPSHYILRVFATSGKLGSLRAGTAESCENKEEILPGKTPRNRAMAVSVHR
jgi:hypothetical protein